MICLRYVCRIEQIVNRKLNNIVLVHYHETNQFSEMAFKFSLFTVIGRNRQMISVFHLLFAIMMHN